MDPFSWGQVLAGGVLRYPPKHEKKTLFLCHSRRIHFVFSECGCCAAKRNPLLLYCERPAIVCELKRKVLKFYFSSCDDRRSMSTCTQPTANPARWRARSTSVDDGLEKIRWIHDLRGESLPAASYGILPNLKKKHFWPFETDTVVLVEILFQLFCAHQQPMRCTERRTQAFEPTLTDFIWSGGGETCRVNSSLYFVRHNVIAAAAGVAAVPLLL